MEFISQRYRWLYILPLQRLPMYVRWSEPLKNSMLSSSVPLSFQHLDNELGSFKESVHLTVFEMDSQPPSENRKSSNNSIMMKQTDRRSKNKTAHTRIF